MRRCGQAMQWYADLHSKHDVKPMFVTDFTELLTDASTALIEREAMIDDGRAAMWTRVCGHAELDRQRPSARR